MNRRNLPAILTAAVVGVVLIVAGLLLLGHCRPAPAPPPTVTLTPPPATLTPRSSATPSPRPSATPTRAQATRTATVVATMPPPATATPTRPPATATPAATAAPALLGRHRVAAGDTMWDIGLWWYRGRRFAWGEDVWRPICRANPEIGNCRLIYPGQELRIPALP